MNPAMPDGEHAESTETEAPAGEADPGEPARRPAKRKRPRAGKPAPTERELNSPDRLTLVLLASVFSVTLFSWGAARFACNLHPPESRPPAALPTEKLSATPKDAAVELQQRSRTLDFKGALELAKGPLASEIAEERKSCESQGAECETKRRTLASQVLTTAVVISQDADSAEVRVTNHVGDAQEVYRLKLEREGPIWKGTERQRI